MFLQLQLDEIKKNLYMRFMPLSAPYPGCVLFLSFLEGTGKTQVFHVTGSSFDEAWDNALVELSQRKTASGRPWRSLKVDLVHRVIDKKWDEFTRLLSYYRRNYFRYGFVLDPQFKVALLEQECSANSILYGFNKQEKAEFNYESFKDYAKVRFGYAPDFSPTKDSVVGLFSTCGVLIDENGSVHLIPGADDPEAASLEPGAKADVGPNSALYAGIRNFRPLSHELVEQGIRTSSQFLASQMTDSGEFIYGYIPGFGRRFTGYNRVRHAGTIFALLAAFEHTQDATLRPAIDKGVEALASNFIRSYTLPSGQEAAFLVEPNQEIKLGGNGVSLVTLSRWQELTGDRAYEPLIDQLAEGIVHMQDKKTGTFVHVLEGADLSVKNVYRTVYYDGEGLFGLARAYATTKNERWLRAAEHALDAFIGLKHWRHHDHWLSYAVNEVTLYKPEDRYFQFGLRNVASHLQFIISRETTYPTLLELCMAAETMIRRIEGMESKQDILKEIDLDTFRLACHKRAEYLFCGYYWPELAMYFNRPKFLTGSFFIRHHGFRTRIDDVGHYLCGLTAYDALFFPQLGAIGA